MLKTSVVSKDACVSSGEPGVTKGRGQLRVLEGLKFTAPSRTEAALFCTERPTLSLSSCTGDQIRDVLAATIPFPNTHSLMAARKGLKITRRV